MKSIFTLKSIDFRRSLILSIAKIILVCRIKFNKSAEIARVQRKSQIEVKLGLMAVRVSEFFKFGSPAQRGISVTASSRFFEDAGGRDKTVRIFKQA